MVVVVVVVSVAVAVAVIVAVVIVVAVVVVCRMWLFSKSLVLYRLHYTSPHWQVTCYTT